ncbi:hypothetical protein G4Y79_08970 [Phototrophicus methaneseepsis]|uniref:Uncharacterized protein n=1 Tax=Phototrophicus methaneseepsis TaxID=2710758 RepID=A0A7S8ECN1_9CHLR|nr:hypothetical protein [Phototrophicus methaneseepsis]QPC84489.1 hypothetical protein G4Y79_08970 [Phototrophicus methaneseepsis]
MNWSHTLDERILHQRRSTRKDDVNKNPSTRDTLQVAGYWHHCDEQVRCLIRDEAA